MNDGSDTDGEVMMVFRHGGHRTFRQQLYFAKSVGIFDNRCCESAVGGIGQKPLKVTFPIACPPSAMV
jgi:hypothetical protein